jgi:hypothetical protein
MTPATSPLPRSTRKRCHSFYAGLDTELAELKTEAERLRKEIVEFCGEDATVVGEV